MSIAALVWSHKAYLYAKSYLYSMLLNMLKRFKLYVLSFQSDTQEFIFPSQENDANQQSFTES